MWDSFIPDLLVAAFGAALTVGIAYVTYVVRVRRGEAQAIRSLLREMHNRRALAVRSERPIPGAATLDDFRRCTSSVISMRAEVRHARDRSRNLSAVQEPLAKMTSALNRYLSESAADPDEYPALLGNLRRKLEPLAVELAAFEHIEPLLPGHGAR